MNIGSTKAGINLDAVTLMGEIVKETAELTADRDCIGCAKLVVFCNAPEDNPFMAGAFHGVGEPDCVINVGVSGPGVVRAALAKAGQDPATSTEIADIIKKTAFKITRMGQLVGTEASPDAWAYPSALWIFPWRPPRRWATRWPISWRKWGWSSCGAHGTTATLAMLNDAVKKGGVMASSQVGGLSGAFIPVIRRRGHDRRRPLRRPAPSKSWRP